MFTFTSLRRCFLILIIACVLSACGQSDTGESDVLEAEAYLDVARLYRNQGQFRASVIEVQNALQALPGHQPTLEFMSRVYLDIGDAQGATQILEDVFADNPSDSEVRLLLAEARMNSGNVSGALELLEGFESDIQGQRVTANWLRGAALAREGNFIAAQEALQAAIEMDPQHIPSLIVLSNLEFRAGNEFGAQQFIDQAIAADPNDLDLWVWRGQFALLREQYPESEQAFNEALEIMGSYDMMTAKRLATLRAILVPLQMQQKNQEALRYSQIIAESPQGQMQSSFNNALSFFEEEDFSRVESELAAILANSPEHPGSNLLLGLAQYAQGDYSAAMERLSGLVNSESTSPMLIKTLASSHLRLNQPEAALSVLQEAEVSYPEDASLPAMIGITQHSMRNYDQSIEAFNRAIALQSDNPNLHFALARSLYQDEQFDAAIEQLQITLEINPDHAEARRTLVDAYLTGDQAAEAAALVDTWLDDGEATAADHILAGRVAFVGQNLESAQDHFEATLEIDPENNEARLYLARIAIAQEDYNAADTQFRAVIGSEPNNVEALVGLIGVGELSGTLAAKVEEVESIAEQYTNEFVAPLILAQYYMNNNNVDQALANAEIAYARSANSLTFNAVSGILTQQIGIARREGDLDRARELVSRILEMRPRNLQALINAAGIESQAENYSAAESYVEQVKEFQPEGSSIGLELEGDLSQQRGENAAALASYREAWEVAPSSSLGAKTYRLLMTTDQNAAATEQLNEWFAVAPQDPAVNLLLGMAMQAEDRVDEAIGFYETTYGQDPNNIIALNNLAWLYQNSNPDRALELSSRAAQLVPQNADVLDTYGWILLQQGNRAEAVEVLERAARLAPDNEAIIEHLEEARQ